VAKTKTELFTLINDEFPDNTTGQITPAKLREVSTQLADSMLYAAAGTQEVEILRALATVNQLPTSLGTPIQLNFGVGQYSVTDPVMITSAGLVTFNTPGNYAVRVKVQCGRTGAAGVATLLLRAVVNGMAFGVTAAVRLDNSNSIIPLESRFIVPATAGTTMLIQLVRDAADSSINAGGLYTVNPVTAGWSLAPSALIVISRLEAVP
jgi:hypothetical protein